MKLYETLQHTADIRIRVRGKDLKSLFSHTAAAMFDIMASKKEKAALSKKRACIRLEADNTEELLVSWLNELLALSAEKKLIFSDFTIQRLTENSLKASVSAQSMTHYTLSKEIKAATYHQLSVTKTSGGWKTEVIFDV